MKKSNSFLIVLLGVMLYSAVNIPSASAGNALNDKRPNIIFILTDDQGSVDMNCYGSKDLKTPNMDALAETGIRFSQFYVAAPVCSPSRASLLTGLNPHAAGLPGNASSHQGHAGMPSDRITIAEALKEHGYTTGHIGKWHLGFTPETMPNGQGFDYSFGHMGGCIDNFSHFFYWNGPNRHDLFRNGQEIWKDGEYFPSLMVEEAEKFIDDNQDNPFFLYFAINLPHYPLQPELKWREYYDNLPHPRSDYAAFVSTIDDKVGDLISYLEENDLRKNTVIIIQSDHGHSVEQRTFGGGGNAGPFRGAKFSLFEGGIRVPAIISWPENLPQGSTFTEMAVNVDWFPTILDLCEIPNQYDPEGKTLLPYLKGEKEGTPHDQFIWKNGISWAIREGNWKLIGNPQDPVNPKSMDPNKDSYFLANMELDSTEQTNFASKHPEIVDKLIKEYLKWEFASKDDLPLKREKIEHLGKGKRVDIEFDPDPKYEGDGPQMLVDGQTGTRSFKDGLWMGFHGDDMVAIVDLGEIKPISEVSVGSLHDPGSWIFALKGLSVSFSKDGKTFTPISTKETGDLEDLNRPSILRTAIQFDDTDARFIKVTAVNIGKCPAWHQASGSKAYLFVDEIAVK
ncbi:sulfatase-like hydrolase/transferase [Marinilabilia rubra]|uniref:Sulfatase n=1 Tax=Marinilabilia rubra TaxID=2162893 RepID=A0A2U2B9T0_9BACT|nr:sulfatase-like hydrolase/transferase [Marinilabilia rubra]PWD99807.1 hypothetical protein DDZ16_07890 [Marinilabilia rubra]